MTPEDLIESIKSELKTKNAIKINIKLNPKSKQQGITGVYDKDILYISVNAAPEKDKANQALIKLLSKVFSIPISNIRIIKGQKSRHKIVELSLNKKD